jgi:hypothetical protein
MADDTFVPRHTLQLTPAHARIDTGAATMVFARTLRVVAAGHHEIATAEARGAAQLGVGAADRDAAGDLRGSATRSLGISTKEAEQQTSHSRCSTAYMHAESSWSIVADSGTHPSSGFVYVANSCALKMHPQPNSEVGLHSRWQCLNRGHVQSIHVLPPSNWCDSISPLLRACHQRYIGDNTAAII